MLNIFTSVILVVQNAERQIGPAIRTLSDILSAKVSDYEILVVDNGSTDETVPLLEMLAAELPNLQVYALSQPYHRDVAIVAGLEQAIGDYVALFDPLTDDLTLLPRMIDEAVGGHDVVLVADPALQQKGNHSYRLLSKAYVWLFRQFSGVDLRVDAPSYRLLSRRVVNYVMQHRAAFLIHQVAPLTAGFRKKILQAPPKPVEIARDRQQSLYEGLNQGLGLLLSFSALPMRLVSVICLSGALVSLLYSIYVVSIYMLHTDVAPGWTTLSLQVSGMFLLLSLAVGLMSEYMVRIAEFSGQRPLYHIAREFRSASITHHKKLNILSHRQGQSARG